MSPRGGRLARWRSGWRLALRVAARDARRARLRSLLAVVMIALPVLAVTAADVVISTADVSSVEGLDRRLGTADARVTAQDDADVVDYQDPDPDQGLAYSGDRDGARPDLAQVRDVLGRDVPAVSLRQDVRRVRTAAGVATAMALETELDDPLAEGLARLDDGRWPRADDEVVVNRALLDRGLEVGGRLELVTPGGDLTRTIVGVAESATYREQAFVAAAPGGLALPERHREEWLLGGGPMSWQAVLDLNRIGVLVLSRAVVLDPPESTMADEFTSSGDDAALAVLVLVVVMVLLEVVLLAGPAFAVGAKRQARTLALMAASGGTPPQARRVVLATAVVLGGVAAVAGLAIGVVLGWALLPVAQRFSGEWFGPLQLPWLQLLGVAGFGLLSALLAAVVPAWIASRHDVVAVLGGRRGDRPPSRRSPLLGLLVVAGGVAGSAYGAGAEANGEFVIAASAVVVVLGMILLVPVVVATVSRVAGRLPLPVRYAARDAARHRTRTVPAVAAVAATVAGVVALGIGVTSDEAENRETYQAMLPMGDMLVRADGSPDWPALRAAVTTRLPGQAVAEVRGVPFTRGRWTDLAFRADGEAHVGADEYSWALPTPLLVGETLPTTLQVADPADRQRAADVLADGGVVVLASQGGAELSGVQELRVKADVFAGPQQARPESVRARLPGLVVEQPSLAQAQAVLSPAAAARLGVEVATVALTVDGSVSPEEQEDVEEAVAAVSRRAEVYVERGYQADDETVVIQLILGALGAVLVLGGTLTATFLALSDARPDLATLASVGAAPRTRRAVAASYALVVALVGAVLGAAVGFVPGIAVTYPLTSQSWSPDGGGHHLDVPWLLVLAVVAGLPLLSAALVGLSTRSRLPLAARAD